MKLGKNLIVGLLAVGSLVRGAAVEVGSGLETELELEGRDLLSALLGEIESATTCAGCDVGLSFFVHLYARMIILLHFKLSTIIFVWKSHLETAHIISPPRNYNSPASSD